MAVPRSFNHRAWRIAGLVAMPAYVLWTHLTIGLRAEHLILAGVFLALFTAGRRSAWFAVRVLPFLVVGVLYDNLRLIMHMRGSIHVEDLYLAEKALFSVQTADGLKILPELFQTWNHPFFDAITGVTYMLYLAQIMLFGAFLFFKDSERMHKVAWGFFIVNIIGWATWIVWPAAPPWYVDVYGLGPAVMDAAPSAAGTARFDELFGVTLFQDFYSRSSNVFGAMPSLHCAYPTIVAAVAWRMGNRYRIPAVLFALLMGFSAVYLQHHYVLDVLAGYAAALVSHGILVGVDRARASAPMTEPTASAVEEPVSVNEAI